MRDAGERRHKKLRAAEKPKPYLPKTTLEPSCKAKAPSYLRTLPRSIVLQQTAACGLCTDGQLCARRMQLMWKRGLAPKYTGWRTKPCGVNIPASAWACAVPPPEHTNALQLGAPSLITAMTVETVQKARKPS